MDSEIAIKQLKYLKKLIDDHPEKPRLAAEGWDENWKTLVAIILSAQTRDTKTIAICDKLFNKYDSVEKLGNARLSSVEKMIKSVNYHKTKSRNIKITAKMISENGIGESVEDLIRFPGVGRKTANVFLAEVKKAAVIGVDTHVGRISRKMGWTKNVDPYKVEKDLENLFPKKYWGSINYILVTFGQTYGRSRKKEDEILGTFINRY